MKQTKISYNNKQTIENRKKEEKKILTYKPYIFLITFT